MTLCPYCNTELDLKLSLEPVDFDQQFKDNALKAMSSFIEFQAEVMPFGGVITKKFRKIALKFAGRYFDKIGAFPITILSCKKCDKAITVDIFQASDFFSQIFQGKS
ncbi:MAG: hypothetical protein KGD63_07635 [Candidatus Lokiarchaeota archaeon]|nr:hypothetical protein [Candidatus Lokiarchaeota archaeon]